jgi:hypothetical protein
MVPATQEAWEGGLWSKADPEEKHKNLSEK